MKRYWEWQAGFLAEFREDKQEASLVGFLEASQRERRRRRHRLQRGPGRPFE